ncbi:prolipoprotein diacylglyceryl transferase [Schaalia georgiae F0490]|uniref:Phosphatidylglycerol--prolipoprotein diacylglyceryl transferase n=1 Tax=Schaalia georgiae F0490 TaxID=1125717 RepID=J0NC85_9ACTO|nr:prolipoprotein diacylglyceryl transferase [Schaalia georgiae]EJF44594.1 prolipoprotein diacylglyceryl transferase [Schaalia georgiae F0490]
MTALLQAGIPSPSVGVWYVGPVPLRAYGIIIAVGMVVAIAWAARRYARRGGDPDLLFDLALWAIPMGIVGARLYHVITSPDQYFGPGGHPWQVWQIWRGGLGIWGAVALGAVGAWIGARRAGARLGPVADSLAPALLVGQAIGRWGNWFNQELFGAPTTAPWGLRIDAAHMPPGYPPGTLFHPTFLYECLWNLAGAALIVRLERRLRFKAGQVFSLYLMVYTAGRVWIEALRIDDAHRILGVRLNVWTSLLVFAAGAVSFLLAGRLGRPWAVAPGEGGSKAVGADSSDEDTGPGEGAGGDEAPSASESGPRADGPDPLEGEAHDAPADDGAPADGTGTAEDGPSESRADGAESTVMGDGDGAVAPD